MRQKDRIELVIRLHSPPDCMKISVSCSPPFVCFAHVCVPLCLLCPTLVLLTMANVPVCLHGIVSQKQQHIQEGLVLFGFLRREHALIREAL